MDLDDRDLNRRVGERIQERRRQLEMTRTQLADAAGVLRTTVANIETGRQRIPLHILYKIAASLDMEAYDLMPPKAEVGLRGAISLDIDGELRRFSPKAAAFVRQVRGEEEADAGL
jgi:transcriptional regulator with XRE-family HTH domain